MDLDTTIENSDSAIFYFILFFLNTDSAFLLSFLRCLSFVFFFFLNEEINRKPQLALLNIFVYGLCIIKTFDFAALGVYELCKILQMYKI
jgi:hypothetical protein